ncbi:hypothetical protein J8P74_002346 [Salmonella enterica]|nr:hypothetical protein [Salmonella enterica]
MAKNFLFLNFRPHSGVDSYDQIYTLLNRYYENDIRLAKYSDDREFDKIRFGGNRKVIVYGIIDDEYAVQQYRKGYGFKVVHFGTPRNRVEKGDIVLPVNPSIVDIEAILFDDDSMSREGIRRDVVNRSGFNSFDDDDEPMPHFHGNSLNWQHNLTDEQREGLEMLF